MHSGLHSQQNTFSRQLYNLTKPDRRIINLFICIFMAFFLVSPSLLNAQKIDTIYHTNGNVLTGDLRKLNYGVVTYKMAGIGSITIETPEIKNIKSKKEFEVRLNNGMIYFGSFDTTNITKKVKLNLSKGTQLLSLNNIVEVYPIKNSFWLRTIGNFSMGFNYSLGSSVATFTFSGNLSYRKRKSLYQLSWDNNNTFQGDSLGATNINFVVGYQHTLKNYWSLGSSVSAYQNSQLGVKLRLDFTAIAIRDIVYNKWNRYFVGGGLSVQRETPFDDTGETVDLAGMLTTVWKVYKYTNPKIWVDSDLSLIPYITGDWRYRVNFNMNPRIGVIGNTLQVGFKFYYSYDSRPPSNASSTYDWGINFTLTYALH